MGERCEDKTAPATQAGSEAWVVYRGKQEK